MSQGNVTSGQNEIILISSGEAYEIISSDEDIIILDVRTPEEFNEGHLEGAFLLPVDKLEGRKDELPANKTIIVYCRSGVRSNRAADLLVENGFSRVYDMGGILDWQEEGYPVVIEVDNEGMLEFNIITVDEAYDVFLNDERHLFIDVRSVDEYSSSHIHGAVNIPVSELQDRLEEIPNDKTLIVYCNGSSCDRSRRATRILIANGFEDVRDLTGKGIFEWEEKGYPIVKEE